MAKRPKLIIVGDGETGQIAYEYFTYDSNYEVTAFCGERNYLKNRELYGLPVVSFEDVQKFYPPNEYVAFVAISYNKLNRIRARLYNETKKKGYKLASYVSSKAFVWRNVEIGENCFIFENNVIQHKVKIGNNVILWSGNHIGHQTVIKDHVYISSHVVISGYCEIGESCFLGVNSSLNDKIKVGKDVVVGNGAIVIKNLSDGKVYVGNPARPLEKVTSYSIFNVDR